MSKRYIDTNALLEALPDDLPYKGSVKRVLIQAPTADVVEVVRCRDCKYYRRYEPPIEDFDGCCNVNEIECDKDFYCQYGERKEE